MASYFEQAAIVSQLFAATLIAEANIDTYVSKTIVLIKPMAKWMGVGYVVLWGFAMMRGLVKEPVMDFFMRVMKMLLISNFALSASEYTNLIKDFVWSVPTKIVSELTGANEGILILVNQMFSIMLKLGSNYITDANSFTGQVPDLSLLAIGIGTWGGGAALTGIIAGTIIIAHIVVSVLLSVGPIFIMCLLFESTKKMFDAWLGMLIGYMITLVLTTLAAYMVMEIMAAVLATYLPGFLMASWFSDEGWKPSTATGIGLIVMYGICGVAIQKIAIAADAIGRGISISDYTGH